MARTVSLTRYPLLKVLVAVAVAVFAIGLWMFFDQPEPRDPQVLLWFSIVAAAVAFAGLLWKRKEKVTVVLPSDRLQAASRTDLQGILETLEAQRERGELSPERYTKARNRVLKEMDAAKKAK